jgi:hypothetical protein
VLDNRDRSSSQQSRSRLGIEAQRETLRHFVQAEGFEVAREFVEVESGKGSDCAGMTAVPFAAKNGIDLGHLYWKALGIAFQTGSGSGR